MHSQAEIMQNEQPDKLISTIEIKLTSDQKAYLQENKADLRTLLLKKFNLKFSTTYSKLQLTRAIEVMNMPIVIPPRFDPDKIKNVHWKPRDKVWEARVTVKKKPIILYRGSKEMAIQAVKEYRKNRGNENV